MANGNAEPVRRIEGQNTLMAITMHEISYDHVHDEIVVPQSMSHSILTFRGDADGEVAPIRVIQGSRTGLVNPDQMDIDPIHNEIYVPVTTEKGAAIFVFDRTATGNVAPIRRIEGPDTGLGPFGTVGGALTVTADPAHDLLLITGMSGGPAGLLIFSRTANGNVKPLRIITGGPKSGNRDLGRPHMVQGTDLFVASSRTGVSGRDRNATGPSRASRDFMGESEDDSSESQSRSFVGAWSVFDNGDVPPRWAIAHQGGGNLAVDPKNKTVIVASRTAIMTYSFPEIFQGK
jgi:hypothetical protein